MFFRNKRKDLKSFLKKGNLNNLKSFIENGGETTDASELTLLHLAVMYNKLDLIKFLLNFEQININAQDSSGTTPLLMAFRKKRFESAKLLLNANARIDIPNEKLQTPLTYVVKYGIMDHPGHLMTQFRTKWLEISTDLAPDYIRVMMYRSLTIKSALKLKSPQFLAKVLSSKASISPSKSRALVVESMYSSDLENLRVVLSSGPDRQERIRIFQDEFVCLIDGSYPDLTIAKILVKQLIEWNMISHNMIAFFRKLFKEGSSKAIIMLMGCGIVEYVKRLTDKSLIPHLFANKNQVVMQVLHDRETDVNARGINGFTPLHVAFNYHSEKNIQILLDKNADVNLKDDDGKTPLFHVETVECFMAMLSKGVDVQVLNFKGFAAFEDVFLEIMKNYVQHQNILGHLAIIEAQGLPISQEIYSRIRSKALYRNLFHKYRSYVNRMKKYVVCDSVTMYTILVENPKDIWRGMENKRVDCIKSAIGNSFFLTELRMNNPYYFYRLKVNAGIALKMGQLKSKAMKIVAFTLRLYDTDHLVVNKIVNYLNYEDLCVIFQ